MYPCNYSSHTRTVMDPGAEAAVGREGLKPPYRSNLHEAPLSLSYKFEKEEGGEGLEEEEGEAAPPAVIPGSATGTRS